MNAEVLLFLSQFATVFLLGVQSQNIRDRQIKDAALASLCIGVSQCFQWRMMPNATPLQMAIWLCAGPLAIVAAMKLYPWRAARKESARKAAVVAQMERAEARVAEVIRLTK